MALHVATCVYTWGTALCTLVACRAAPQCCEFVRESLVLFMHVLRLLSCYPRKIRCGFRHTYSTARASLLVRDGICVYCDALDHNVCHWPVLLALHWHLLDGVQCVRTVNQPKQQYPRV